MAETQVSEERKLCYRAAWKSLARGMQSSKGKSPGACVCFRWAFLGEAGPAGVGTIADWSQLLQQEALPRRAVLTGVRVTRKAQEVAGLQAGGQCPPQCCRAVFQGKCADWLSGCQPQRIAGCAPQISRGAPQLWGLKALVDLRLSGNEAPQGQEEWAG